MFDKLAGQLKSVLAKRTKAKEPEIQPHAEVRQLNRGDEAQAPVAAEKPVAASQTLPDPLTPTAVVFMAAFTDKAAADDIVAMSGEACDCSRAEVVEEDGSETYLAAIELSILPSPETIAEIEQTMRALAESLGGTTRGWRVFAAEADTTGTDQTEDDDTSIDPVAAAMSAAPDGADEVLRLPAPASQDAA